MAYNFVSASSHYIERLSAPVTAVPVTIACWFKQTGSANQSLVSLGNSGGTSRFILQAIGSLGQVGAYSVNSANGQAAAANIATLYSENVWTHAAGVWASATSRIAYCSGAPSSTNTTNIAVTGVNSVVIGGGYSSGVRSGFFNGDIAEVAIWNVALGADEITMLSKGCSPRLVRPSALVYYAPLIRELVDLRGDALTASGVSPANHPRVLGL